MTDLDLTTLRLFVAVCETGNMARAAEQAGMVGSAVSKRLAQLEATVGTPLLLRRRHGVEPSVAGLTLLEHARGMLASAARIEHDMAAYTSGLQGKVRIVASATAMAEGLVDDIAAFLNQPAHRAIQVDLEESNSPATVRAVSEGSASLGVCWSATGLGRLDSRPYRADHLALVVPQGHVLAGRKSVRFAETLDYEHVSLPLNSSIQLLLRREAARLGKSFNHRVVVGNYEAALLVIRAGLAIGLVPRELTALYGQSFALTTVPLTESWTRRQFVTCFRDENSLTAAARLLLDTLTQRAATANI